MGDLTPRYPKDYAQIERRLVGSILKALPQNGWTVVGPTAPNWQDRLGADALIQAPSKRTYAIEVLLGTQREVLDTSSIARVDQRMRRTGLDSTLNPTGGPIVPVVATTQIPTSPAWSQALHSKISIVDVHGQKTVRSAGETIARALARIESDANASSYRPGIFRQLKPDDDSAMTILPYTDL